MAIVTDWHAKMARAKAKVDKANSRLEAAQAELDAAVSELAHVKMGEAFERMRTQAEAVR